MINKRFVGVLEKHLLSKERIHVHAKINDVYASGVVKEVDAEGDYLFLVDTDPNMDHHLLISEIISITYDE